MQNDTPTFNGKTLEEIKLHYAKIRNRQIDFYNNSEIVKDKNTFVRLKRFSKLLMTIRPISKQFMQNSNKATQRIFIRLLRRLNYGNLTKETLVIIYVNQKLDILSELSIQSDSNNNIMFDVNTILNGLPFNSDCTGIILAHNHPMGNPYPSPEDAVSCNHIMDSIRKFDIELLDSFVVTDSSIVGILSGTLINY